MTNTFYKGLWIWPNRPRPQKKNKQTNHKITEAIGGKEASKSTNKFGNSSK